MSWRITMIQTSVFTPSPPSLLPLINRQITNHFFLQVLNDHWCAYVRVNYHFGLNAVRNARPQDFIWIHDYHLMLTGQIMRSLDSNLEVTFILFFLTHSAGGMHRIFRWNSIWKLSFILEGIKINVNSRSDSSFTFPSNLRPSSSPSTRWSEIRS